MTNLMAIGAGIKKFGIILQKTYAPSNSQRLTKFANKEAKKEIEIREALKIYKEKTNATPEQSKAFEKKLREESSKPKKPIFENVDQAMQKLDKTFGSTKVNEIKDSGKKYQQPKALQDPFGKTF